MRAGARAHTHLLSIGQRSLVQLLTSKGDAALSREMAQRFAHSLAAHCILRCVRRRGCWRLFCVRVGLSLALSLRSVVLEDAGDHSSENLFVLPDGCCFVGERNDLFWCAVFSSTSSS